MWTNLKTEMLIYQSKANADEKVLFGKITHILDPEIRKMLETEVLERGFHIPFLVRDLLDIEI